MTVDPREQYYRALFAAREARDAQFDRLGCETLFLLAYTFEALERCKAQRLREFGLTLPGLNLLSLLRESPDHTARPQDLAPLLLRSAANITGLVDSLEQKGFVERVDCPHDRRSKLVRLRPEKAHVVDDVLEPHFEQSARFASVLSRAELKTLQDLLARLRHRIQEEE